MSGYPDPGAPDLLDGDEPDWELAHVGVEEEEGCSRCGSPDLTGFRAEYYSGVVAPDGGRESLTADVVRCRSCGHEEAV